MSSHIKGPTSFKGYPNNKDALPFPFKKIKGCCVLVCLSSGSGIRREIHPGFYFAGISERGKGTLPTTVGCCDLFVEGCVWEERHKNEN